MTDKELIIAKLHQHALDALQAMQSYADAERERAEIAEAEIADLSERLKQSDAKRMLVIRRHKNKVIVIYREDDVDVLRVEVKKNISYRLGE